jgi:hypothetical protein
MVVPLILLVCVDRDGLLSVGGARSGSDGLRADNVESHLRFGYRAAGDRDGQQRRDPTTGKAQYSPIVEIKGKQQRERFQAAALDWKSS